MDSNTFIWSCSRKKFTEVMAKEEYEERLFRKFNAVWNLRISIKKKCFDSFGEQARSEYPVWFIYLEKRGQRSRNVIANVIRNTSFPDPLLLSFPSGNHCRQIDEIVWSDIKNFFLDIVLIFEKFTSHDSYQISDINHLSWNLESMFNNGNLSDIRVKCSSFSMKAHKNILSARSPVFEAYFMSPMKEQEENVVVIDDMEPDVCHAMLFYMYCGRVEFVPTSTVCGLLSAAEKYKIESLKQECLEHLKSRVSDENVYQILETANLYDKGLKNVAINFLCRRFSILSASEDWEIFKLKHPLLTSEIYSHLNASNQ